MKLQIPERVASAEVAQAAGPRGRIVHGPSPLAPGAVLCGPAFTCACAPEDNLALHRALLAASPGAVLVAAAGGTSEGALLGELMALDALRAGITGLVTDGPVRDAAALEALPFPVFHRGFAPRACGKERLGSVGEPVELGGVVVVTGDVVVADRDGIVVVDPADWPEIEAEVRGLREREEGIKAELAAGRRLGHVLGLDEAGG